MFINAVYAWPLPEVTSTTAGRYRNLYCLWQCGQPAIEDL